MNNKPGAMLGRAIGTRCSDGWTQDESWPCDPGVVGGVGRALGEDVVRLCRRGEVEVGMGSGGFGEGKARRAG